LGLSNPILLITASFSVYSEPVLISTLCSPNKWTELSLEFKSRLFLVLKWALPEYVETLSCPTKSTLSFVKCICDPGSLIMSPTDYFESTAFLSSFPAKK